MIAKKWVTAKLPKTAEDLKTIQNLQNELNISIPLATLLWQRDVTDFDTAKSFFNPDIDGLHNPFLMKDMDLALARLEGAIENKETIVIYGDYDVDGTTAVALVYGFLSKFYEHIHHYNPDRYKEGYGVSQMGIDHAVELGATLMITLDCGIKSIENVAYAKSKGLDFIICDHHEPGEELPAAIAVLDPKRKDCPYPYKELTGNGVGFKLLTAYCLHNNIPLAELFEYIDLAMVSIASDIVPITGENRILAHHGLLKLNTHPRPGLKALKEVAGFQGEMTIESVVFTIGPRINAAGRIKHAKAAVDLLLTDDYEEAVNFAYVIQQHNTERKTFDSNITEEALEMIRASDASLLSTVLYKEDWHKGVIGIVASRCIEHYYRPTVIFTKTKEGFAAGSARSIAGINLYDAIEQCSDWLEQFGGHMHAAGMTIPIENIEPFAKAFNEVIAAQLNHTPAIPHLAVDVEVSIADLDAKFYRIMKRMGPFGPKNMQPVFQSVGVRLANEPRVLKEKHLKLEIMDPTTGTVMTALAFNMAPYILDDLRTYDQFDIAYSLEENNFRGQKSLQLYIKDVKFDK